jgi:hypothetical protein
MKGMGLDWEIDDTWVHEMSDVIHNGRKRARA